MRIYASYPWGDIPRTREAYVAKTRELLAKQGARILQPDLARTGGIMAMKKIAALADVHYVNIAPHNPNGPLCTAATLHVVTSIPNFLILEPGGSNDPLYKDIFPGGWKASPAETWVPEVPGIGVDFSPQFLKEHTVTL